MTARPMMRDCTLASLDVSNVALMNSIAFVRVLGQTTYLKMLWIGAGDIESLNLGQAAHPKYPNNAWTK